MNHRLDMLLPQNASRFAFLIDLGLITAAILWAVSLTPGWWLAALAMTAWTCTSLVTRLYSPATPRRHLDTLGLNSFSVAIAAATLVPSVLIAGLPIPMETLLSAALLFFAGTTANRIVFMMFRSQTTAPDRVLIVGTSALGRSTHDRLTKNAPDRKRVVGFLAFENEPDSVGKRAPIFGSAKDILAVLEAMPVDEVYVAGRVMERGQEIQALVDQFEQVGMPFAMPLHAVRFERAQLLSSSPARDGYLHYLSTTPSPVGRAAKRLIDIFCSSAALALLSPLLFGVAAIIKLTSKGPVMFRQERVGLHGHTFSLLKFRSMRVDAEEMLAKLREKNEQTGPVFKMARDPRVTGIGRFIRKYSIDELPQLVNILRGEMSIVGPRPAIPSEVAQYKAWQRRRLSVRPGLTCYWQVMGRNSIGFEEWMRLDLNYVDNWTLALDMQLIMETFPVVVAGRGAS